VFENTTNVSDPRRGIRQSLPAVEGQFRKRLLQQRWQNAAIRGDRVGRFGPGQLHRGVINVQQLHVLENLCA
jgi:hypothetical protein